MQWQAHWRLYRRPLIAMGTIIVLATGIAIARRHFVDSSSHLPSTTGERENAEYTCSMHPQVRSDKPGDCPICGMRLVRRGPISSSQVYIEPDRQRLIGMKTAVVEKREAVKEIRTVGRVAFDPELLVAQREYVTALRLKDRTLETAAEMHLRHMGISDVELARLRTTRAVPHNLYLPQHGEAVWIYAPLYEHELPFVSPGATAKITLPTGDAAFTGTIRSINPIVDPKTRSAHARIEVPSAGGTLRPEAYVNAAIHVALGEQIVIPISAVIDSGDRKIVVVAADNGYFAPREIQAGPSLGDAVVVKQGLIAGERVVTQAAFLVDSESRLKSGLQGEGSPASEHEGHQHP
ncbi:MAG: efflux RND transporter periplasmic adaptor subunit [Deltaproteobacteria bacterium]|nr:efflux RND transporter periplasmic adaptor subunit [Deltaproteobacteria bacterium]